MGFNYGFKTLFKAALVPVAALSSSVAFCAPPPSSSSTPVTLYVCTTKNGKTITSDRPPEECSDRAIRELRGDGSTRRIIDPPLTDEQKEQREIERKKRLEDERLAREQLRKDRALLEAYGSETEIDEARDRQLAQRSQMVDVANKRLEGHLAARKKLENEKEFYLNREMPTKLKRDFAANDTILRTEEKVINGLKADMVRINEHFDEERRRFRELVKEGAAASKRNPAPPLPSTSSAPLK